MKHKTPWKTIVATMVKENCDRRVAAIFADRICKALIAGLEESDNNIIFVLKDELTWGKIHEKENSS